MSWSSSVTVPVTRAPGMTSCMRFRLRRKVDLPQPDGPIMAVTCLGSIVMLTSARAYVEPYQAFSPSTSMRFAMGDSESGKPVAAGEKAGDDGEDQHEDDQRKGSSPRAVHRHLKGRLGLDEDEERQARLRALERVRTDAVEAEGREQQGSGFARNSGH